MKKYIYILLAILAVALAYYIHKCNSYEEKIMHQKNTIDAYMAENGKLVNQNIVYEITARELKASLDSLFLKLDSVRKALKIKDKNLIQMQYISQNVYIHDTLRTNDTIFNYDVKLDTIIQDKWHKTRLSLSYPSSINISTLSYSSNIFAISSRKVTVNPPRRFFLFRWFLKKQRQVVVDIVQENPMIVNDKSRFVQFIK